jgi:hypothetical protein
MSRRYTHQESDDGRTAPGLGTEKWGAGGSDASAAEDEFVVGKTLKISNTSAARSTFLAGYTYYEIGRYWDGANFIVYPFMLAGCFCFAVISAACAAFISYYIQRAENAQQARIASEIQSVVKLCHGSFEIALLFFSVSISLIGMRYYPGSKSCWIPCGLATLGIFGMLIARGYWQLTRRFIGLATRAVQPYIACQATRKQGAAYEQKKAKLFDSVNGTAFQSVLVLSFAQAGIARYQPYRNDELQNTVYLIFASLGAVFAMFSLYGATSVAIFMTECPNHVSKQCLQFVRPFLGVVRVCLNGALLSMMIALLFIGWGASYPDAPHITGDGYATTSSYHDVRFLPMAAGCFGLTTFVGGYIFTVCMKTSVSKEAWQDNFASHLNQRLASIEALLHKTLASQGAAGKEDEEGGGDGAVDGASKPAAVGPEEGSADDQDLEHEEDEQYLVSKVATYGTQATITASTVFYNIATFETDVLNPYRGWG